MHSEGTLASSDAHGAILDSKPTPRWRRAFLIFEFFPSSAWPGADGKLGKAREQIATKEIANPLVSHVTQKNPPPTIQCTMVYARDV